MVTKFLILIAAVGVSVFVIIAVTPVLGVFKALDEFFSTTGTPTISFHSFPPESVRPDDPELDWLRAEEAPLNLDSLGVRYWRSETPALVSGGLYAGQLVGAVILVCYATTRPLEAVSADLDTLVRTHGWTAPDYADRILSGLAAAIRSGENLDGFSVTYSKPVGDKPAYLDLGFGGPEHALNCGKGSPGLASSTGSFGINIQFLE